MTAWMLYSVLTATLLLGAACTAETSLRLYRWPVRWTWVVAFALALALPLIGLFVPESRNVPQLVIWSLPEVASGMAAQSPVAGAASDAGRSLPAPEEVLASLWFLASLGLAMRIGLAHLRLRQARDSWRVSSVAGTEVLISRDLGPAVTGFLRGAVLVPAWVRELDEDRQRLIVAHELEHLRAGDHRLLLVGLIVCVLVPWNLPLWWGLRRLRLAMELDCDRRLLRAGADPRRYGSLLVEVGQRASTHRLAAAFAERATALERRIRQLMERAPRYRVGRAALLAMVAAVLVALACGTRAPSPGSAAVPQGEARAKLTGIARDEESRRPLMGVMVYFVGEGVGAMTAENGRYFIVEATPGDHVVVAEKEDYAPVRINVTLDPDTLNRLDFELRRTGDRPHFTPFTVRPELTNRQAAVAAIDRHYPDSLKAMGIGGTANIWMYVDVEGRVESTRVQKSSGYEALDQAAMAAAREFEFTPARNRDQLVPVWIAIPITFSVGARIAEEGQRELQIALRLIATAQEQHYAEADSYYPTLADTLRGFLPAGTEVISYQVEPQGWALVLRRGVHECAMYYGQVPAPTDYALAGRAVCRE